MVATRKIEDGQTYVVVHHGDDDCYSVAHGREGVYRALLDILVDRSRHGYRETLEYLEGRINVVSADIPALRDTLENLNDQRIAITEADIVAPELMKIVDQSIEDAALAHRRQVAALTQLRSQRVLIVYLEELLAQEKAGTLDMLADVPEYIKKVAFIPGAKNTTVGNFILHELLSDNAATVETTTVFS